jgi:hypothetical protein
VRALGSRTSISGERIGDYNPAIIMLSYHGVVCSIEVAKA